MKKSKEKSHKVVIKVGPEALEFDGDLVVRTFGVDSENSAIASLDECLSNRMVMELFETPSGDTPPFVLLVSVVKPLPDGKLNRIFLVNCGVQDEDILTNGGWLEVDLLFRIGLIVKHAFDNVLQASPIYRALLQLADPSIAGANPEMTGHAAYIAWKNRPAVLRFVRDVRAYIKDGTRSIEKLQQ